ncbi:transglycosylase SLT domain-containing protein [Serratia liquefaciens]|uniref:transglycosylase SLT domain-containing protein n=1 Tax=Serratia liquefaciens TaxID=614 RepID=UPI00280C0CF6|nr:transglycosylase SLT domain-containing protein [Serratia liquefaciens]
MKIFTLTVFSFHSALGNATCWDYSAKQFGIEARLLASIAQVESGMNPTALGKNSNGSVDIGLMQINSVHLPKLKKIGIDKNQLTKDPCTAVLVGASILAEMMQIYGYSWEAVGAYNAGTAESRHALRMKYAKKVWSVYNNNDFRL